jgi:hypothetical protein
MAAYRRDVLHRIATDARWLQNQSTNAAQHGGRRVRIRQCSDCATSDAGCVHRNCVDVAGVSTAPMMPVIATPA